MPTVRAEDIKTHIKQFTDAPGVGDKSWDDIFHDGEIILVANRASIINRIITDNSEPNLDPSLQAALNSLRFRTDSGPGSPFLRITDPWRQQPVNPGTIGPGSIPQGYQLQMILGERTIMNPPDDWQGVGPQGYVVEWGEVITKDWKVEGGAVQFLLHEGKTADGPWTLRRALFTLSPNGFPHQFTYLPTLRNPNTYWRLRVKAKASGSVFEAYPFRY